jgi:hypothetical protein
MAKGGGSQVNREIGEIWGEEGGYKLQTPMGIIWVKTEDMAIKWRKAFCQPQGKEHDTNAIPGQVNISEPGKSRKP